MERGDWGSLFKFGLRMKYPLFPVVAVWLNVYLMTSHSESSEGSLVFAEILQLVLCLRIRGCLGCREGEERDGWFELHQFVCLESRLLLSFKSPWSVCERWLTGWFHLDCGEVKGWYAHSCWKGKFSDTMFFIGRNIVSTVNMDCKLDLKTIALHARNAEYNPKVDLSLWPCLCISCYIMSCDW